MILEGVISSEILIERFTKINHPPNKLLTTLPRNPPAIAPKGPPSAPPIAVPAAGAAPPIACKSLI